MIEETTHTVWCLLWKLNPSKNNIKCWWICCQVEITHMERVIRLGMTTLIDYPFKCQKIGLKASYAWSIGNQNN